MRRQWLAAALCVAALTASGCVSLKSKSTTSGGGGTLENVPKGCVAVDMATSPEKFDLLTDMAKRFNGDKGAKIPGGGCALVRIEKVSSGTAMSRLAAGWPEDPANGPRPIVWSPASSAWGSILNQKLADAGQPAMATPSKSFMLTPLVIAMPRRMAQALGWPNASIGYADILKLAQDPAGWGSKGHPEWGPFKLGKTNPNFSTSALSATIAEYYAAVGKQRGLTLEDLANPKVDAFARGVESAVVHYGDITLTFLNNWYRNDARGTALTYVSAVAVEEKSVIDYNRGNPDGILDKGEVPRPPREPLVAIYPKEGTLFSDSPFIVLDASWSTDKQKAAARAFGDFVQLPDNQRRVVTFGFRPGNPAVAPASPIDASNGVDPNQPQNVLGVPDPPVMVKLLDLWGQQRKGARVLLVIDVSGSMGDAATGDSGPTKLDLAKQAAVSALDQFKADDLVGLRIFSTGISGKAPTDYLDLVPVGPIGAQKEVIASKIRDLVPTQGTPLYTTAQASYDLMRQAYDATRINAVVLLTDGRAGSEGQASQPVRVFTIGYGKDADLATLRRIAEATNAAAYDASNPNTIVQVFINVISNF